MHERPHVIVGYPTVHLERRAERVQRQPVRATLMLLASREELPNALVAELMAYRTRLDALYPEVNNGFQEAEGILNACPSYIIGSLVGELCQPDADDLQAIADRTI